MEGGNGALKEKLMNLQEDLEMADRIVRSAHSPDFVYNDIWRKRLEDCIEAATAELDQVVREYQRIFENNKA